MRPLTLVGLLLIPAVLIFWLYTRTPQGDARVRGALRPETPPAAAVGARLESPSVSYLSPNPGSRGWLLLRVGDCSGCLVNEIAAWEESAEQRGYRLVILTTSDDKTQDRLRSEIKLRGAIVHDDGGAVGRWLGDGFTPRAYLFDVDWKLRAVQKQPFPDAADPMKDPGLAQALAR